jgi:tetratricopeptide (TPR) repeat protein
LQDRDGPLADSTRAVELAPKYAAAWVNRGVTYARQGKPDEAVADFSRAIDLDPKYAAAWLNRGVAYAEGGKPDKAVADYTKAIELAPNDPQLVGAYLGRARVHCRLNQFERARTDYQTFLKRVPSHHAAHNELAWLLATCPEVKVRDPDEAVKSAKKAVHLAPQTARYWNTLGLAHYRAGDGKAAVAALDKAGELSGGDASSWLILAMAHRRLGNHDDAREAYGQAVRWLEKNKEVLEKAKASAEEYRRLRAEAEEVLGLTKK